MKIIVLGGTGFIGYHTCLELLKNGHQVSTVSLNRMKKKDWFPDEIKMYFKNVFELSSEELIALLNGYDALVYSIGPDDRKKTAAPAYDFFHEKLVSIPIRIFDSARKAGIKKAVVAGSYFCYFERTKPELNLSKHPYIQCRKLQSEALIKTGNNKMDVMIMEFPYIFGCMPEREPLWKEILFRMLHDSKVIFYPKGGTVMIPIQEAVKSIIGAIELGKHGKHYYIGTHNMDWNTMLKIILDEMGMENKKIIHLPTFIMPLVGWILNISMKIKGHEPGLNPRYITDFMCQHFYYDDSENQKELGYQKGDIDKAIRDTVRASLPF